MEDLQQSRKFNFVDTSATKRIFELDKRIRAVTGGTGASKTVSILIWLIDYCQSPKNQNKLVSVVSESYPHLLGGAMLDFEMIMKDREYWEDSRWVKNPRTVYTFETGNKLEFFSVDTYGKAHGPRRDVLFVNECNNLAYNIIDQLIVRTRETIWLDWNPVSEFWFYTEMMGIRDDIDFITLTYKDNEGLDESTVKEIESHKHNRAWWQVYGLGQLGDLEGKIYTDWQVIDDIPEEARLEKYGLDFGYSVDPTASDAIYKWNDSIILDEVIHQKGLSNRQIAELFLNLPRASVIADSAEPKSIDEIASFGVPIFPSTKGKDSIRQGIQVVQDQKVFITKRSVNTLKEYRNYLWKVDREGKTTNEPADIWNHHMDDIRYAISSGKGTVVWEPGDPGGVKPFLEGVG
ncbi:terminase [Candidatus Woesebacteria bacterium]|nr:terminase [Candidatus Woesebacteria bacterium]